MKNKKHVISLKTAITSAILFVSFLTLTLSVAMTTWLQKNNVKGETEFFAKAMSEIVAFNAIVPLTFDQRKGLKSFLDTLQNIDEISNIHIYRVDEITQELSFFTSYNRSGILPVNTQTARLKHLSTPQFTNEYVEYSLAIQDPKLDQVIGHVYMRLQLTNYNKSVADLLKVNVIIAILIALIAFFVAQTLRNRILRPIKVFVDEIETAAKNQEFNKNVSPIEFSEIGIIANAVNSLLKKINIQIRRFSLAEQEITELNQNLEEKVVMRTKALRDSNQELLEALEQVHQYQSQVIQSEKMASLGQMVAGVAHEVNTPIGLGVTASTLLGDKIDEITVQLNDKTLSAPQLSHFLEESKENTQIIYRNLTRAADLISSFKQVAVDQTVGAVRNVDLGEYLHEIILSMQPTLKKYRHTVEIECEEHLFVITKPGPLNQVIINLTMNALLHAFKSMEQGAIVISVKKVNDLFCIEVRDNGCGIEEKIKQKIFDPFVTTSRGEGGAGLGLHLVYNLVTQALKGKISVHSELSKGAQFNIEFPSLSEESLDER